MVTSSMVAINARRRWYVLLFAVSLGFSLALGLLPLINEVGKLAVGYWIFSIPLHLFLFPMFSFLIWLSLPMQTNNTSPGPTNWPLTSVLPILISFLYGYALRYWTFRQVPAFHNLLWYCVSIPLGEEFLFRGWVMNLSTRLLKQTYFSLSNPIPCSVLISSIAFALWHVQNAGQISEMIQDPLCWFQVFYTFFCGIWLGYVRFKTGGLARCILIHSALNFASLSANYF